MCYKNYLLNFLPGTTIILFYIHLLSFVFKGSVASPFLDVLPCLKKIFITSLP